MKIDEKSLLIIPCCKTKKPGGLKKHESLNDPLCDTISHEQFNTLKNIQQNSTLSRHIKNTNLYMPAIERYTGNLYKAHKDLITTIREKTNKGNKPKLLILSALYGPLHPESPINDYELKMPSTKSGIWWDNFPKFLSDYVSKQNIKNIHIYCGITTGYYKVLCKSIEPLFANKNLDKVIHHNVINGSSSTTPRNHGLQLLKDISDNSIELKFTREINHIEL